LKLGHSVTLVEGSADALEILGERQFDCILMDIQMPGMDGYETTAAIREMERDRGLAPHYIVAMTAHAMKGDQERCLSAGMDDYISKPFRVEGLTSVLAQVAKRKPEAPENGDKEDLPLDVYLASLEKEDREDLLVAAEIFLETFQSDLSGLERSTVEGNFKQSYFVAHNLKSVVGYFGRDRLMALLEKLEGACEAESGQEARRLLCPVMKSLRSFADELAVRVKSESGKA